MKQSVYKYIGLCYIIAFVILLLASPDSYTHDLYQRTDSANFYTSGKALANGLIPYKDFADSKGPLLWVIYAAAYMLSGHNYVGVFWLSTILYAFVFFCIFKLAHIFLKTEEQSLLVVILMASSFFSPWFHYEIRAEDWLQLFIVLAIYRICFFLYTDKGKDNVSTYITCFLMGICITGTFYIKYNCTVMIGAVCLYLLYALIREKKNIVISFASFFAGIGILALPWIIYAIHMGCFDAFIHEYITNTMQTLEENNKLGEYLHEWLYLTYDTHCILLFAISYIGAIALSKKVNKYKNFFIISFIVFYAIGIHRCAFLHWYYITVCLLFPVWSFIYLVDLLSNSKFSNPKLLRYIIVSISVYTIISNFFFWGHLTPTWFFRDTKARAEYYKAAYYMSQVASPTVIYYLCGTLGIETPVDGLPATTYWTTQIGATPEMMKKQIDAISSQRSDFIIAADNNKYPIHQTDSFITSRGYHPLMSFRALETDFIMYSKHHLNEPPSNFHVSNTDVILKKKLFK